VGDAKPQAADGVEAGAEAGEDSLQDGDGVESAPLDEVEAPQASSLRIVDGEVQFAAAQEELPTGEAAGAADSNSTASDDGGGAIGATGDGDGSGATGALVRDPRDPQCLAPAAPAIVNRPPCVPWHGPVLSHTRIYRGNDADLTEALEGYVSFRDDHRFGGWKSYLARSEDFTRFCCHMHICEMLSARGGSRKTEVVYRWSERR
jgi:hypothetical protein